MTVKELIERLSQLPPEWEVCTAQTHLGEWIDEELRCVGVVLKADQKVIID